MGTELWKLNVVLNKHNAPEGSGKKVGGDFVAPHSVRLLCAYNYDVEIILFDNEAKRNKLNYSEFSVKNCLRSLRNRRTLP